VSFAADGPDLMLYRQRTEAMRRLDTLGALPAVVRRAIREVRAGTYALQVRVEPTNGERWLTGMHFAHVVPLAVGSRDVGALVLGTSGPGIDPLDERGLVEIATRAAIAFDNAQLYSSLEREISRAKAAEEKLQQANRRKDEFLAMLSHELRNPLAPIVTAAQVLEKVAPNEPRITWVREVVERQVTHLAGLVDDLLDVSRITQGKITLHREAVELGKVIEHSIEIVRPQFDAKRHALERHVPDAPIWVFGDFARLSQIVSNVLHNAVKYTADGGRIVVRVVNESGSVTISVADNGMGIEPQFLPHVFEVFTQGYRGLDRSQGGLGVGLAVVQRLVELHQGEATIYSAGPGLGTEVRITLPCISEVPQSDDTRSVALPPRQEGKRILVVDDNADAAESIAVLLRLEGHEVKTVTDGMQALACIDVFAPHVAVIDIGLPGMNGYEVARHIRSGAAEPTPLMIALTGYGQAEDLDRSREAGFDHHFVKPADPRAIQDAIESTQRPREGFRTSL
jgi:signal transduction histidine kinase/CheY-like chemotaxis protein